MGFNFFLHKSFFLKYLFTKRRYAHHAHNFDLFFSRMEQHKLSYIYSVFIKKKSSKIIFFLKPIPSNERLIFTSNWLSRSRGIGTNTALINVKHILIALQNLFFFLA